jgi:hypothetical protein
LLTEPGRAPATEKPLPLDREAPWRGWKICSAPEGREKPRPSWKVRIKIPGLRGGAGGDELASEAGVPKALGSLTVVDETGFGAGSGKMVEVEDERPKEASGAR